MRGKHGSSHKGSSRDAFDSLDSRWSSPLQVELSRLCGACESPVAFFKITNAVFVCLPTHRVWPALGLLPSADPFRTCPEELADACDTAGASLSRRGSHAQLQPLGTLPATQPPQAQQAWGSGPASQPGMHATAAAEEGGFKQPGSGLSPAASEDEAGLHSHATARTFAERMRADAGPLRSRGHLAAALCKARQDVSAGWGGLGEPCCCRMHVWARCHWHGCRGCMVATIPQTQLLTPAPLLTSAAHLATCVQAAASLLHAAPTHPCRLATHTHAQVLLSVFVTRPAVWSPVLNLCQEFVAMTIM